MEKLPPLPDPAPDPEPLRKRDSGKVVAWRAVGGFLAYIIAGALTLTTPSGGLFIYALLVATIVILIRGNARGFALGVFIGVGLTLLGVGLCFVVLSKSHF